MRLALESMAYGPYAIAHTPEGKTVLVKGAIQGDVVEAEILSHSARFDRAQSVELLESSPFRKKAPCALVGRCGGCPWGALAYPAQKSAKRTNVEAALSRIGGLDPGRARSLVSEVLSPSEPWGYRNKVEFALATAKNDRLRMGFYDLSGHEVVAIATCPLLPKRFEKLPKRVAGAVSYLAHKRDLDLQRIGLRISTITGAREISLWTPPSSFPRSLVAQIVSEGTKATGVIRVMTKGPKKARRLAGLEVLFGKARWKERLDRHAMAVSAPSFFQVNTAGAEALITLVLDELDSVAKSTGREPSSIKVWDLYSGAGTFTLPLARRAAFVEAVESYGPAIRDLRYNLERARLENVEAIGGDAAKEMPEGPVDLIVCDPPRAGLSSEALTKLSQVHAQRLVYVSCDPQTLARDVCKLENARFWRLSSLTPLDLFPETYHVECVAIFSPL